MSAHRRARNLAPRPVRVERIKFLRLEEPYDKLYQRYKDRKIVERQPQAGLDLPAGTLIVPLDQELARPGADLPVSHLF